MRRILVTVALVLLLPGVASAGGGGDISLCPGFATGTTLSMLDSCFNGTAHFAPANTALIISNDGAMAHTFTAVDGTFDSGQVQPGETFELTIDEPGVYEVFCSLHGTADGEGMAGVLLVGEAEPLPVSAAINMDAIKEAVAEDDQEVIEALDRNTLAIGSLRVAQASMEGMLEGQITTGDNTPNDPAIVTVPVERTSDRIWVPMVSGLAIGLAMAALFVSQRSQRRFEPLAVADGLQPSLES